MTRLLTVAHKFGSASDLSQRHSRDWRVLPWQGGSRRAKRLKLGEDGFHFEVFEDGAVAYDVVTRHDEQSVAGGGGGGAVTVQDRCSCS